jgi:hypothetical protein
VTRRLHRRHFCWIPSNPWQCKRYQGNGIQGWYFDRRWIPV